MPIRSRKLGGQGIDKATRLERRDAGPGGPAKFEWLVTQDFGKNEVKLTQGQMMELILFARSWMREMENPIFTCGCSYTIEQRTNPSTGACLLFCHYHAELHDAGAAFDVYPE